MDVTVAEPALGSLLDGRYRIHNRIARGGMATVYRATDERLERVVAIKVIHPSYAANPQFLNRFEREAKTIARLTHTNVVGVYDSGTHSGLPYLVMEYVPGRTLRDLLSQRKRLPAAEALAVMEPVLAALAEAHRAGLVHRDVKPENVLIGDGSGIGNAAVKVADFGLARAVAASTDEPGNTLVATVAYVAPEQVTHGRADPRSDVYSAGVMFFELLTGRVPFTGDQPVDVAYQHVERDVPAPSRFLDVPAAVDNLVLRATRRDPDGRPADAATFLNELHSVRSSIGGPPRQRTVPVPTGDQPTIAVPRPTQNAMTNLPRPFGHDGMGGLGARAGSIVWVFAAIVSVLGLVAAFGGWWLSFGRYVDAPHLVNLPKAQAEAKARKAGFSVGYKEPRFSERVPKDVVMAQSPAHNGRIERGGKVLLTLSRGPERYPIPELIGKTRIDASDALNALKLEVSFVDQYSEVQADRVIGVTPAVGTEVRPGDKVTVTVSRGGQPIAVPNVVGAIAEVAKPALEAMGFQVHITERTDPAAARIVVEQSPVAGTKVAKGGTITLVVSKGPELAVVPSVSGLSYDEAEATLRAAGFDVVRHGREKGRVYAQTPGGGTPAAKGSKVHIWLI